MLTILHAFLHANPVFVYAIVIVILMLESSGVPITNTTLLLFVGALACLGQMNIWVLGGAAIFQVEVF